MVVKINEILLDVEIKKIIMKKILFNNNNESLQETHQALRKKYG